MDETNLHQSLEGGKDKHQDHQELKEKIREEDKLQPKNHKKGKKNDKKLRKGKGKCTKPDDVDSDEEMPEKIEENDQHKNNTQRKNKGKKQEKNKNNASTETNEQGKKALKKVNQLIVTQYTALNIPINENYIRIYAIDALDHLNSFSKKKDKNLQELRSNILKIQSMKDENGLSRETESIQANEDDKQSDIIVNEENSKVERIFTEDQTKETSDDDKDSSGSDDEEDEYSELIAENDDEDEESKLYRNVIELIQKYPSKIDNDEVISYIKTLEVPDDQLEMQREIIASDSVVALNEDQTRLLMRLLTQADTPSQKMQKLIKKKYVKLHDPKQCKEIAKLFRQLQVVLIPNIKQQNLFDTIFGIKTEKPKNYSILNLKMNSELVADIGDIILNNILKLNIPTNDIIRCRELIRAISQDQEYDSSEIVNLYHSYSTQFIDQEIYDFLTTVKPSEQFKPIIEKLLSSNKSIEDFDEESVNQLLDILNAYPSQILNAEEKLKAFIREHKSDKEEAADILNQMKGRLMLTKEIRKNIQDYESKALLAEIIPLLWFIKANKVFLKEHDQQVYSEIKGKLPEVTRNDMKALTKMKNYIKEEIKKLKAANNASAKTLDTKPFFTKAPQSIKDLMENLQYQKICSPAFTKMRDAFSIWNHLNERVRTDTLKCITAALELMANNNSQIVKLAVQIFSFAFNADVKKNKLQIMPVLIMQSELIDYELNNNSLIIIESTTGSGKTLITPAIFMQRAQLGKGPKYFVMTQPSYLDIKEKSRFFNQHYIFRVFNSIRKLEAFQRDNKDKPAVLILTSFHALRFFVGLRKEELQNYIFCIDESHNRSVVVDVLYSLAKGKVPLIMMSATPCPCFGTPNFVNRDAKLFPVQEIKVNTKRYFQETVSQTINIMKKMKEKKIEWGHILVFTSGNRFSKGLLNQIFKQTDVPILKVRQVNHEAKESFFKRLDTEIVKRQKDNFLILPIQMAGFLDPWVKDFVRATPKKYAKLIKLIVSTNTLETSLTIDGLKCVIDSGVYNDAQFDSQTGVRTIKEIPITLSMQKQRAGRVGRLSSGISVQISNGKLLDSVTPNILKDDLSQSIILMRGLGINLEQISLPTRPKQADFDHQLNILRNNGIIDETGKLTKKGKQMSIFGDLPPFTASSIIDFDPTHEGRLFALFISLIIYNCSETTILPGANQSYFCPESDVVTIASMLLDVLPSGKGILSSDYQSIVCELKQIVPSLFSAEKKNVDLCNIKAIISHYLNGKSLLEEVNKFITILAKSNPNWANIRKVSNPEYNTKPNGEKEILYNCSEKLSLNSNPTILVHQRPIWTPYCTIPTEAYVLSIKKDEAAKITTGSLIHMVGGEFLPELKKIPEELDNEFGCALVQGYLSSSPTFFQPIVADKIVALENSNLVFQSIKGSKQLAHRAIEEAFSQCQKLMMFTPRSIILRGTNPRCHYEMIGTGSQDSSTNIYSDGDHPHAYRLDKSVIDFILQEKILKDMESSFPHYRICMTAEGFSALTTENMKTPTTEGNSVYCVPNHVFLMSEPFILGARTLMWECLADPLSLRERLSISSTPQIHGSECQLYVVHRGQLECRYNDQNEWNELKGTITFTNHTTISDSITQNCIDENNNLVKNIPIVLIEGSEIIKSNIFEKEYQFIKSHDEIIQKTNKIVVFTSKRKKDQILANLHKDSKLIVDTIDGVLVENHIVCDKIEQIQKYYGGLIIPSSSDQFYFFNADSAISFMQMVKSEANEVKDITLNLPEVPRSFYYYKPTKTIIDNWIKKHLTPKGVKRKLQTGDLMIDNMPIYYLTSTKEKESQTKFTIPPKFREKKWRFKQTPEFVIVARADEAELIEAFPDYQIQEKKMGTLFNFSKPRVINSLGLRRMKDLTPIDNPVSWFANFNPAQDTNILLLLGLHFPFKPKVHNFTEITEYPVNFNGPMISGPREEIRRLLDSYLFEPITDFPYKIIPIKKFDPAKMRPLWYFDQQFSSIIVPKSEAEEAAKIFGYNDTKIGNDLLFCIDCCDESRIETHSKVPVYTKDRQYTLKSMCHDCILALFQRYTSQFYINQELKVDLVSELPKFPVFPLTTEETDEFEWPHIPLGRLFMCLIKEPAIAPYLRAWISGRMKAGLLFSGRCTYCPIHSESPLLIRTEKDPKHPTKKFTVTFRCPHRGCQYIFDGPTRQWHKEDQPVTAIEPKVHCCPRCRTPCVKTGGCDEMKCHCGCHWCYLCPIGQEIDFKSASECYRHIRMVHKNEMIEQYKEFLNKTVDVVFLIDATGSMSSSIKAAHDKAREIAEDFRNIYPDTLFRFGSVCYRDPVDSHSDCHEISVLDPDINKLVAFLSTICATGGGDGPEDFVGAFKLALNQMNWNDGPKNIILIADAPAHGARFCQSPNHEDQTQPFVDLIKEVAKRSIFLSCIAIGTYPIYCFNEMEKIYNSENGPSYYISPFTEARSTSRSISAQIGQKLYDESYRSLMDSYQLYYENDV